MFNHLEKISSAADQSRFVTTKVSNKSPRTIRGPLVQECTSLSTSSSPQSRSASREAGVVPPRLTAPICRSLIILIFMGLYFVFTKENALSSTLPGRGWPTWKYMQRAGQGVLQKLGQEPFNCTSYFTKMSQSIGDRKPRYTGNRGASTTPTRKLLYLTRDPNRVSWEFHRS